MKTISEIIRESKTRLDMELMFYDDGKNAIWNYVAGYTVTNVNKMLRNGMRSKELDRIVSLMDGEMKPIGNKVLYRTVDWDYMNNVYGITKQNLDDNIGKDFVAKGYTSTTSEMQNIWGSRWSDNELCMELNVEGSVCGVDVNSMFDRNDIDCYDQKEVLLQRGISFRIFGYAMMNDKGNLRARKDLDIYYLRIDISANSRK